MWASKGNFNYSCVSCSLYVSVEARVNTGISIRWKVLQCPLVHANTPCSIPVYPSNFMIDQKRSMQDRCKLSNSDAEWTYDLACMCEVLQPDDKAPA